MRQRLLPQILLLIVLVTSLASCSNGVLDGVVFEGVIDDPGPEVPPNNGCGAGEANCGSGCVDTQTNPLHCGGCSPCIEGSNSQVLGCDLGGCEFFCNQGFEDANGDLISGASGDGCECQIFPERCNGEDDDCDGEVDEGVSNACGGCGELQQLPGGVCGDPECGVGNWRCDPNDGNLVFCDADGVNECGGCEVLDGEQGDSCGECDALECQGPSLVCLSRIRTYFRDQDGDGVGLDGDSQRLCEPEDEFTATESGDCDDGNSRRYPGAIEVCDGLDNNCNMSVDTDDVDFSPEMCGRQEGVCAGAVAGCEEGGILGCTDLTYVDHAEASGQIFDGEVEITCDEVDNDCDGRPDENCCQPGQDGVFLIGRPSSRQVMPSMALDPVGANAAVAWIETDDQSTGGLPDGSLSLSLHTALTRTGMPSFDEAEIDEGGEPSMVRLSGHERGFEVASIDGGALRLSRFDREGGRIVAAIISEEDDVLQTAIASRVDGHSMVAWKADDFFCTELIARHVPPTGPLGPRFLLASCDIRSPAIALGPQGALVVSHTNDVRLNQHLTWHAFSGEFSDPTTNDLALRSDDTQPTAAASADGYLVAFVAEDSNQPQIHLMSLDSNGVRTLEPRVLTEGSAPVRAPWLVALQEGFALAWVEGNGPQAIRYQRLDLSGEVVGPRLTLISDTNLHHNPFSISVGPPQRLPSLQWLALVSASAASTNLRATPDRLELTYFTSEGQPICFTE